MRKSVLLFVVVLGVSLNLCHQSFAQETWFKEGGIRVDIGPPGSLDSEGVQVGNIVQLPDGTLRMYYAGWDGRVTRQWVFHILSAISTDGGLTWIKEPGSRLDSGGLNDSVTVNNPEVIVMPNGTFRMYYEGFGAPWQILSAVSSDGFNWTKENGVRIAPGDLFDRIHVVSPDVVQLPDGRWRMYYSGSNDNAVIDPGYILSAVSVDGINWTKEPRVRLSPGNRPDGLGESHLHGISVMRLPDGTWKMYYTATDKSYYAGGRVNRILSAVSSDGLNWVKEAGIRVDVDSVQQTVFGTEVLALPGGGLRMFYNYRKLGVNSSRIVSAVTTAIGPANVTA